MKNRIILIAVGLMLVTAGVIYAQDSQFRIGGLCDYDKVPGTCEITSVAKTNESINQAKALGGPNYEGYAVEFKFNPAQKKHEYSAAWAERITDLLGIEYALQLANSWYPGDKYLKKYKIAQGKIFNCVMCLITKGTCAPVVFQFPEIDTADYFENKK